MPTVVAGQGRDAIQRDLVVNPSGLAVEAGNAPYASLAERARVFSAVTDAAGVAPGTALGTTSAFALENPLTSGVNLFILTVSEAYKSGTLGTGATFLVGDAGASGQAAATPIVTSTNIVEIPGRAGSGDVSKGRAHDAATVLTTPVAIMPLWTLEPYLATTVTLHADYHRDIKGLVMVPPGSVVSVQNIGASGSTPLVYIGMTWAEVPVV